MNRKQRERVGEKIRYELQPDSHTFKMCSCGVRGCRTNKCWECWLEYLEENKKDALASEEER